MQYHVFEYYEAGGTLRQVGVYASSKSMALTRVYQMYGGHEYTYVGAK